MKHFSLIIIFAVLLAACKKEEPALFTIPVTNLRFEVNSAMSPLLSHDIPLNNVNFNSVNLLQAAGIDTANIKSILPRRATLYLPFADNNLDFIKEIAIRLCLPGDNQSNCGQEAFWYDETNENRKGADHVLFGSNVDDLRKWVLTENVNLQIQLEEMWRQPNGTFEIFLDLEFDVR
ncbi:MAG: hypothetical protein AAFZ15_13085 [Bacteroidota bacterium]